MMDQPLISIIVPVYKVEPFLRRCVDSIINQTYTNIEIILVDDGSPDKCPEICDEYGAKDPRIKVYHQVNSGVSAARNLGLDNVTGNYIGFVDGDDWIHPRMYEKLLDALKTSECEISACAIEHYYSEDNHKTEHFSWSSNKVYGESLIKSMLFDSSGENGVVWNKLFYSSIWEKHRFDTSMTVGEDFWAFFQIAEQGLRMALVNEPLYYYVHREESTTMSIELFQYSKKSFCDSEKVLHLLEKDSQQQKNGILFYVMRFFVYSNYAALENKKEDFLHTRRHFLLHKNQIQKYIRQYPAKYFYGYLLVRYLPHLFWQITKLHMAYYSKR